MDAESLKQHLLLFALTFTVVTGMVLMVDYTPFQIPFISDYVGDVEVPPQLIPLIILLMIFFGVLYIRTKL